jgi:predicted transcriptional regulator
MATLTLELPPDLYDRLHTEANRLGKPVPIVAQELLSERLATPIEAAKSEQERGMAALRAAGLLAEPSAEMKKLAEQSTMTLEEARAVLDRSGGQPLSELILEMRGPKE